jgi:hypothetical protein
VGSCSPAPRVGALRPRGGGHGIASECGALGWSTDVSDRRKTKMKSPTFPGSQLVFERERSGRLEDAAGGHGVVWAQSMSVAGL